MALWARLRSFWHNVLHRSDVERNMSDELQFHLERRAEDLIARGGLSPAEAMRIARLEFGSVEKYKEEAPESRAEAVRRIARRPAICVSHFRQKQRLYGGCDRDARARHRREHGGVQRRRRAAPSQASGEEP